VARAEARVQPSVLRWAREARGISAETAANRLGVKEERLEAWERGDARPTVKQLRRLADVYRRPLGVFYLSDPPEDDETVNDFRRLPDVEERASLSPELRLEIRLAHSRREEALELARSLRERPPRLGIAATMNSDPEDVASRLLRRLDVSLERRRAWRDSGEAFNGWRAALETCGVLVFQTGGARPYVVDPKEARGFSIADQPFPVVVANGREGPAPRTFTLLHELAHIALRQSGLCDLHWNGRSQTDRMEVWCNRLAGAVLVPAGALRQHTVVRMPRRGPEWSDAELTQLARTFAGASREVVLRRLLTIGLTTRDFYQEWREQQRPPQREGGFLAPSDRAVKRNGLLFPRLVFEAHEERRIPLLDVANLLELGPRHLAEVRARALREEA